MEKFRELQERLASEAEDGFREFELKGISTERPLLGVRMPKQRLMAKEILKEWPEEFLKCELVSFEEVNIRGLVIAGLPYEKMIKLLPGYVKLIDNWATCDTFCNSLKSVREHREEFLEIIEKLLGGAEFEARVGLVCLLEHYVVSEYLQVIFEEIEKVKEREEYYIKMAVAWLVAEVYAKYPEVADGYMKTCTLPKWTYNKAISKICDSYRVSREAKEDLKKLRK